MDPGTMILEGHQNTANTKEFNSYRWKRKRKLSVICVAQETATSRAAFDQEKATAQLLSGKLVVKQRGKTLMIDKLFKVMNDLHNRFSSLTHNQQSTLDWCWKGAWYLLFRSHKLSCV